MLKRLALRRFFIVAELWLFTFVLFAGAFVAVRFLGLEGRVLAHPLAKQAIAFIQKAIPHKRIAGVAEVAAVPDAPRNGTLRAIKPRPDYDVIIQSGIFGTAGQKAQEAPPPPPPPPPPPVEEPTTLPLDLKGTCVTADFSALMSSAIIANKNNNGASRSYDIGATVMEDVVLQEIRKREVILLNKKTNKLEKLSMEDKEKDAAKGGKDAAKPPVPGGPPMPPAPPKPAGAPAAPAPAPANVASSTPGRVNVDKKKLQTELMNKFFEMPQMIDKVKPQPYRDPKTGQVAGVMAAGKISDEPLAQMLGLQDGDVLQSVNGEVVDSEQRIMELVQRYQNTSVFRIGILRGGSPQVITYRLDQ